MTDNRLIDYESEIDYKSSQSSFTRYLTKSCKCGWFWWSMQCSSIELSLNRDGDSQKRSIRGRSGDIMAGDMGLALASLLACADGPTRSGQRRRSTPGAGTRCGQVLRKTRRSTSGHGCSLSMTRNGFFVVVLSKWPRKAFIDASRVQTCGNTSTWLYRKRPSARNVALVWLTRHRPQRCFITYERCMGSTCLVRRLLQAKKPALMLLWCRLRVLLLALQQKVRK